MSQAFVERESSDGHRGRAAGFLVFRSGDSGDRAARVVCGGADVCRRTYRSCRTDGDYAVLGGQQTGQAVGAT